MNERSRVLNKDVNIILQDEKDYICLTDIAGYKDNQRSDDVIRNWIRNRNTREFLGLWESIYNKNFNPVEFDGFKKIAGLNDFALTPKQWIKRK
ncbi:KilA-N domain-containing protein [Candidatus Pacearchaeota archaeon]|nr:KilA-N domain-containing protein [Candidatus Pacearchaeota archaeon]